MLGVPSVCPEVSRTVCHTLIVEQLLGLTVKVAVSYTKARTLVGTGAEPDGSWWELFANKHRCGI